MRKRPPKTTAQEDAEYQTRKRLADERSAAYRKAMDELWAKVSMDPKKQKKENQKPFHLITLARLAAGKNRRNVAQSLLFRKICSEGRKPPFLDSRAQILHRQGGCERLGWHCHHP